MDSLRLASSGIRGFVGTSLTPKAVIDFANAFGTYLDGGRVLIARDTRYSSPTIHAAVLSSLLSVGCEVLDFGICPTPVVQYSVRPYEAAGALSISGGHNGMGWNAITLIDNQGAVLEPISGECVLDIFHAGDFRRCDWNNIGKVSTVDNFFDPYLDSLEQHVDAEAIRKAEFTVLIDPLGGAGCSYIEPFAQRFGLKLIPVNAKPSGYLAREAEPRPRSALQMADIIGHLKGSVGFLHSSDLGRTSLVTETGEPASEEYTFAIIANHLLTRKPGVLVTNPCTTRTIDDIASRCEASVIKVNLGQPNVVSALIDEQGVIGGEGSGSVAVPTFSRAYDGFLVMAFILEAMAQTGEPLSSLLDALPRYHIVKKNKVCGSRRAYHELEQLKEGFSEEKDVKISLTDGIRVDWQNSWIHARPSSTQQAMRIISEAVTKEEAIARSEQVIRMLKHRG